jgi:hypothetical protein
MKLKERVWMVVVLVLVCLVTVGFVASADEWSGPKGGTPTPPVSPPVSPLDGGNWGRIFLPLVFGEGS